MPGITPLLCPDPGLQPSKDQQALVGLDMYKPLGLDMYRMHLLLRHHNHHPPRWSPTDPLSTGSQTFLSKMPI